MISSIWWLILPYPLVSVTHVYGQQEVQYIAIFVKWLLEMVQDEINHRKLVITVQIQSHMKFLVEYISRGSLASNCTSWGSRCYNN